MNYYLTRLTQISHAGGHHVAVTFDDGFTATIDLAPWLARGGEKGKLRDPHLFRCVFVTDEGAPEWPGEIDISPGTLRAWCEAGRVLTKEETDAWIARSSQQTQQVA